MFSSSSTPLVDTDMPDDPKVMADAASFEILMPPAPVMVIAPSVTEDWDPLVKTSLPPEVLVRRSVCTMGVALSHLTVKVLLPIASIPLVIVTVPLNWTWVSVPITEQVLLPAELKVIVRFKKGDEDISLLISKVPVPCPDVVISTLPPPLKAPKAESICKMGWVLLPEVDMVEPRGMVSVPGCSNHALPLAVAKPTPKVNPLRLRVPG